MKNLIKLYSEESHGNHGSFEIEIYVGGTQPPDLKSSAIGTATLDAVKLIKSSIMREVIQANPVAQQRRKDERQQLISCFPLTTYVEEIPNGYCSEYCCAHLPWFIVTTCIGRFVIGWRKSVISIDWSETVGTKKSEEIFADLDVTKGTHSIHAWSVDDARKYIQKIFATASTIQTP